MNRRSAQRLLAATTAAVAAISLSGCTLIQTLQNGGGQVDPAEIIDADLAPELQEYYEQELEWGPCPEDSGADKNAECATALAPMDWDNPDKGEPVELALVRQPATGDNPQGSLFSNPGGPGASGFDFVAQSYGFFSSDLRENFDLVGWDPRGVGRSSAVQCRDDAGMDDYFYGVPGNYAQMTPEQQLEWTVAKSQRFGADCLAGTGELLGYVDTNSTVHDLDLLRALVGDPKLFYFGLSYGTDIGAKYIDQFPERVGRVVLDGATDPTVPGFEVVIDQQEKFADSVRTYLQDCIEGPECPFQASTVEEAEKELRQIAEDADETLMKNADGRVFTSSVLQMAVIAAMYDQSTWQYLTIAFDQYLNANDPSTLFLLSDSYYGRDPSGHYDSNMFQAFTAINCLDYPRETDPGKIKAFNQRLNQVSIFPSASTPEEMEIGDLACENWPVDTKVDKLEPVTGAGADPVLVVATTNDPATPLKWARAVAEQLESAQLLEYEGEGHIAYDEQDQCVNSYVDNYLITGELEDAGETKHC
ncbi:alpha/beta hydrolase [Gulosibacter hominis]|uniref:alpha/beta hydrolase n=1 Tax=Gulosibacter hominis TaxID=2770504 RepID=UPI00191A7245|nr:alpha/beta hydrolase [Gulosibacter hominis]